MPDTRDPRSVIEAAEQAAAAGDYTSAERLLREAAELQEATLGPLHPDVANTLNNLGVVCEITDKPDDAEQCFRRAYEIAIAVLEPDHPFVATSRKNLEDFCAARGKPVGASTPPTTGRHRHWPHRHWPHRRRAPPLPPLPPPSATDVRVYARPAASVDAVESVSVSRPRSDHESQPVTGRSTRSLRMGALLAAGVFVALLAATVWFRSKDEPGSSSGTPSASPAVSPPPTSASKPIESKPIDPRPVEKPIAPKPTDVPKAIAPARTEPRTPSRSATAPLPKSALVVVDAQLCRDVRSGAPGTNGWRCDAVKSPVAPGPTTLLHAPQVARYHDCRTSVVSRWRPPAAASGAHNPRQPWEWLPHVQSQYRS